MKDPKPAPVKPVDAPSDSKPASVPVAGSKSVDAPSVKKSDSKEKPASVPAAASKSVAGTEKKSDSKSSKASSIPVSKKAEAVEVDDDTTEDYIEQKIETGDSVKVKQVFDESIVEAIADLGYEQNFLWENIKLLLMFISCIFAMVAQFFPIPFPASRPLLGLCCASYFILSVALQYIISYVDKDTIMITNPVPVRLKPEANIK